MRAFETSMNYKNPVVFTGFIFVRRNDMNSKTKRLTTTGVLIALGTILSMITV